MNLKDPIQNEIASLFKDKQEAFSFLCLYIQYVHVVDDCVDEEKDWKLIKEVTRLAALVFNHSYWIKNRQHLYMVERLSHNVYFDSVVWENSEETWKIRDSKVMNQRGYDILFAIIIIEFGEQKLEEFSLQFRQYSHMNQGHHNEADK